MVPWRSLSTADLQIMAETFWSAGLSRHGVADRLNCSKSKANALIAGLIDQGLLTEAGLQPSHGGRPAETLRLSDDLGVLLCVDTGVTSLDVAVVTPSLKIVAQCAETADVRQQGPGVVLPRIRALFQSLLTESGYRADQVLGIGIGVPGPVNFATGQLVNPPLMPEWDGFSIRDYLRDDFDAPIFIDNDVNLMAFGELWSLQRTLSNFMVIKIGTGIGCGIVCNGEVYRGATGSAGDVGHICVDQHGPRCYCGNLGCVETMAAGPAIVRMATEAAETGQSDLLAECLRNNGRIEAVDVGQASRAGDVAANGIIQRVGSLIGQMLASVVNFFNPSHIFIGGGITRIGPLLLAAVRQSVYQRSLPLSTRHLAVNYTELGTRGSLIGAGVLALHETLKVRGIAP